jgi:DNA polymerase
VSKLWIDFETRSHCDLPSRGVYNYAMHATTEVLCMSYAFDDEDVRTWTPLHPFPERVANFVGQIRAHNAAFERLIFKHVLGMDFALEQFYCTATQARANCAPGSLEDVGRFAGAGMRKDHKGKALVRKFCVPPFSEDDPSELIAYCEQDVRAMRAISQSLRELSPEELSDYHINERINDRGVKVDVDLARAAMRYAATESAEIEAHVLAITEGAVPTVRSPKMREWVLARLTPEQLELAVKDDKPSMDKTVRGNLLACDDLDPDAREVVQSADDLWASSVAKFSRMVDLAGPDDRVRGAFVFAGGSATGRASSYGLQVHNFTRKCAKDPEAVRQSMVRGHEIVPKHGKRTTDVLRGMLRPAMIGDFTVADWSAIEARVNPWLSNHPAAESVLDTFRRGDDIYVREARAIFRTEDIDDEQRQIGKVAILACGFGGGVGAFAAMGRAYGISLPESQARTIVDAWRRANPWAVRFWSQLEEAATVALRRPGTEVTAGRITYLSDGTHLWYMLPSGRILCYPYARFDEEGITYARASWKPRADAAEWPRARLWKGLLCENVVQATAADLLRHALRGLDGVVLHVHDEIVVEGDCDLAAVMCRAPEWATGLPLKATVKKMTRYGK